jgi:hypothetical protein
MHLSKSTWRRTRKLHSINANFSQVEEPVQNTRPEKLPVETRLTSVHNISETTRKNYSVLPANAKQLYKQTSFADVST